MNFKRIYGLIITGVLMLPVFSCELSAQVRDTTHINGKDYILHEVEKGNTLYSLSRMYEVSVDVIINENPAAKEGLSIGQVLRIPLPDRKEEMKRKMELDGNYIVHEIRPKQTLYAISKMYNVDIKDIAAENPTVVYGIKEGELLRIPISKIKKEGTHHPDITNDEYPDHMVIAGETLFSLSQRYGVSVEDIKNVNNGLPEGLKEGMMINIPIKQRIVELAKKEPHPDSLLLKDRYHIALFLPLFLTANDSIESEHSPEESQRIYGDKNTVAALKFYQGVKLALDSMGKKDFKATLYVYDTENDAARVNKLLEKPEFLKMDLIIGPLYPEIFELVLNFAHSRGINIVSPINPSNRQLLGHPNLIKVTTSKTTQVIDLAKYVARNYRNRNVFVLKKTIDADDNLGETFLQHYKENIALINDTAVTAAANLYNYNSSLKAEEFKAMFRKDTQNIVFVPSTDQVFVTELIRRLNNLSSEYDITVIGMERWLKFDNIDMDYFKHLNLHVVTWSHIDYEDKETMKFVQAYFNKYKSFPGEYGNLGFDISYYLFSLMKSYGNSFPYFMEKNPAQVGAHSFRFCQTGFESGYENQSLVILKFSEYQLERVK